MVKGSGATETTINCSNASGLAFVNMTKLTISDLTLYNCSQSRPSTSIGNVSELYTVPFCAGLYIWRCRDVMIENVHINEANGVGLVLYETGGRVSINSSVFHHNGIPENVTGTLQYGGGGVNVEFPYCPPGHYEDEECGKELSDTEYMFINCNFTNNTARLTPRYSKQFIVQGNSSHHSFGRGGGMAIYFSGNSSNNSVSLSNCHFTGNTAVFGGGLLGEFNDGAQNNNLLLINCHFIENTCFNNTQENGGGGGGARLGFLLHEANSVVHNEIHIETTLFEGNKAYLGGGLSFVTGYELGVLEPTNKLAIVGSVFQYNIARLGSAVNLIPWTSPATGMVAKVEIQESIFSYNSVLYCNSSWHLMGFGAVYTYKVPFDIKGRTNFYTNNGSGIYSESTGGHQVVEPRDCVICYFEWWRRNDEWNTRLYFERNLAHESGDYIFVSSLFPCLRSGSNGSADTSIEARRKVFRAGPVFAYASNLTNTSIVTGAATIQFRNHVPEDELHIITYPGEVFNLTTLMQPLDELGVLSNVPFFVTTNVPNSSLPAVLVDPDSAYTAGYVQFLANKNAAQGRNNVNTTVQLQTVDEPALQLTFNVTLTDCLPGSYLSFPTNSPAGQCACARNSKTTGYLTGILCYEHGSNLSIYRQASMWFGEVPSKSSSINILVASPCPQYCDNSNSVGNLVPLNQKKPTSGICRGQSHGILCGTCDHGVIVTSPTLECCTLQDKQTTSAPAAWVCWFAIQIVLTTIIVLVIFLFDFHVIGGTLGSFVFFSQIVLHLNLQDCTPGTSHQIIENVLRPYAVWSLRLRWLLPFNLCISTFTNTLEARSLDYLFALYPFVLIALIACLISKCQKSQCYQKMQEWLIQRRSYVQVRTANRSSFIHGIATCLILTYGDIVSISFFLLSPTLLNVPYNTSDPNDIQGGPLRSYYNGDYAYFGFPHYLFGIWAIIVVVFGGLLPPLFLVSYPWLPQLLRKCSNEVGQKVEDWYQKKHVHHFLELFQGQYKDNHRYFAGVWLLYRLILHANYAFAPSCTTGFATQISFSIFFLLLHSIMQPNRERKYTILDSVFLANIAFVSTLGLVSWASDGLGSYAYGITIAISVFLLFPYLYFSCVVIYRIANWIFGCRRQQLGEQQPLLDVASTALQRRLKHMRKRSSNEHFSDSHVDEGSARDGNELQDSVTYSRLHDNSPVASVAEVSFC